MLVKLSIYKINGSTIIETIIAALIILISFAAGLAIYAQLLQSAESGLTMRISLVQDYLVDSLTTAPEQFDQVIYTKDMQFKVQYETDPRWPLLLKLHVSGCDDSGKLLTEKYKFIRSYENR